MYKIDNELLLAALFGFSGCVTAVMTKNIGTNTFGYGSERGVSTWLSWIKWVETIFGGYGAFVYDFMYYFIAGFILLGIARFFTGEQYTNLNTNSPLNNLKLLMIIGIFIFIYSLVLRNNWHKYDIVLPKPSNKSVFPYTTLKSVFIIYALIFGLSIFIDKNIFKMVLLFVFLHVVYLFTYGVLLTNGYRYFPKNDKLNNLSDIMTSKLSYGAMAGVDFSYELTIAPLAFIIANLVFGFRMVKSPLKPNEIYKYGIVGIMFMLHWYHVTATSKIYHIKGYKNFWLR